MSENLSENQELTLEEQKAQIVEQKNQELLRRRELGELAPFDYDVNYIWYLQNMGEPVSRKDVENHAILIKPNEFEILEYLEFIDANGEEITLEFSNENFDTNNPLIIFPEELGEKKTVVSKTDLEDKMEKNEQESNEPTVEELVEFCQKRWGFSEDEISQIVESGDFASAIANASLIAQENHETTDEEFFAALDEGGFDGIA